MRSVEAREVFEEGFHIPIMKLMRAGEPDATLFKLLRAAVRTPDQTEGDLWAQLDRARTDGAPTCRTDERVRPRRPRRVSARKYSGGARTPCELRSGAAGWYVPYAFQTDGMDEPFTFKVALTVAGDAITVDFAGTSAQVDRAINCT